MKSKILWLLLGLNLALGAMLVAGRFETPAHAQRVVRPNDYIMIPGDVTGTSQGVVYLIDASNGALGAMSYDDANRRLLTMPSIDLNRVFAGQAGGR